MITNGSVSIEDGTKAAEEYAPARKVCVELTFAVPEGNENGEELLDHCASTADRKVQELLHRQPAKQPAKVEAPKAETAAAPKTTGKKKPAKEPDTEKTKADLAKEAGLPTTDTISKGAPPSLIETDDTATEEAQEDGIDDLLGDAAPPPVTDQELSKAAQNKNALMKQKDANWQPSKIRELIKEYAGEPPKKITDIPAAKRREFLDKLEKLA